MKNVFDTYEEAFDDSDDGVVYTTGKAWKGGRSIKGKYCNGKYWPVTDEAENGWVKVELESEYDRGMREAMKDIAKSCGKTFSVDIGYLELPKLVDELVNKGKPKPRTKVAYEPLQCVNKWQLVKAVEDGGNGGEQIYVKEGGEYEHATPSHAVDSFRTLYRKVEKEIDWRDELIDWSYGAANDGEKLRSDIAERLNAFLWNGVYESDFIEMCHLVASLTDKPE